MIPSKELLSEVFGFKVISVHNVNAENDIHFNGGHKEKYPYSLIEPTTINIYELAHKCKEWAKKKEYWAISGYDEGYFCMLHDMPDNRFFNASTEIEAIFKACEWIVENVK